MKRGLLGILMGLALVLGPVATAWAQQGQGQGVGLFCNNEAGNFGFLSHDTCVICLNTGGGNVSTCLCKGFQETDPTNFNALFNNLGECVSSVSDLGNG